MKTTWGSGDWRDDTAKWAEDLRTVQATEAGIQKIILTAFNPFDSRAHLRKEQMEASLPPPIIIIPAGAVITAEEAQAWGMLEKARVMLEKDRDQ